MTKEQEAQQAQTIANVRNLVARDLAWAKQANGYCGEISSQPYLERLPALLEIVDSQAQKIAELTADKNGLNVALDIEQADAEKLRHKIAEQARELKLLRYVLEAEKTARIYEDGTGAAGEALFHARKELEDYDAKITTDSKEVAR